MHFYELQEGERDTFFDLLLFREEEMDADEFFALVQSIRRRIQDSFETESLIEAIAHELEQDHDFVFVSDDRLTAAVNISKIEGDNFLADLGSEDAEDSEDSDEPADNDGEGADYRSIMADFEPGGSPPH